MIAYVGYCLIAIMIGSLEGNKYVNGMLLSIVGCAAGFITGIILGKFKDTHVYILCGILGLTFNVLFYYTQSPTLKYAFLCFIIFGTAGAFNTMFVVMEMRIPPENLGSATVLMSVMGGAGCSTTPTIALMQDPLRMIIFSGIIASGLIWVFILPNPGKYLPKSIKLNNNVTHLQYDNMSLAINDSVLMPYNAMTASF